MIMVVSISADLPLLASRSELVADKNFNYSFMIYLAIFWLYKTIKYPFPDSGAVSLDHMVVVLAAAEPWSRPGLC